MTPLDEDAMRRLVAEAVYEAGTQTAFALRVGVSVTHLSKVLNGRSRVGRRLAAFLGYTPAVHYSPKDQQP